MNASASRRRPPMKLRCCAGSGTRSSATAHVMPGPVRAAPLAYADHTASGRALDFIEDFIRDQVLPWYANTHTEASATGRRTTQLREEARRSSTRRSAATTSTW